MAMSSIEQVIMVPAWKLLRPGEDPIASSIPADVRRRLLELDPFIQSLDQFFPDSGADLSVAANPYADPSVNNRAEMLGRWWLDTGTELGYSEGESRQLFQKYSNEVKFESTVSINASAGLNYEGIKASLGVSQSDTTIVGFQQSKETSASFSHTASCFLIHNQNERDLDGIDIFYDKVFSTFMFRRVRRPRRLPPVKGGGAAAARRTAYDGCEDPERRHKMELERFVCVAEDWADGTALRISSARLSGEQLAARVDMSAIQQALSRGG